MALFRCKMCGGTLEINGNETVFSCEYCGTKQTLPRLDDERRVNLYDRANHFRRNNEFDKAMGIYEQILNEDNTDAEAYWSLVLCRYGIEYVEDPSSHRRIPTVNRAQFTSIFDDDNYKSALQYADGYQRNIYEEEAKAINEIQKGILAISQREEPFDVFICYKETDNNGRRTPDSVLANDLYHQLIQEGFKVFFSRITLEDKLGTAYEPYIFAALNSAKVMVVLGTKSEYFNAVWVKNEWSRYLALIKQGKNKILIPAYRDMDPYDLPEEFSHLQAQDMTKLGFMQDLIRGIKKIVQVDTPKSKIVKETVIAGGSTNIAPLLRRAFMFLEDGNWTSADEYCEKILDVEPENASAYLGKLMAELRVRNQETLKDCPEPFDANNNYQKAVRFADDKLKIELTGYIKHIKTRNENERLENIYIRAKSVMVCAKTEKEYKESAALFESISEYKDAAALAKSCYDKAEIIRKDDILARGKSNIKGEYIQNYDSAISLFEQISGWKDADEMIIACQKKIEEIKIQMEIARKREKIKRKRTIIIALSVCIFFIVFIILLSVVIIPNNKYNDAIELMEEGKYSEAISAFEELDGYKDSQTKIKECNDAIIDGQYKDAMIFLKAGKVVEAYEALIELNGYKDSAEKAKSIYDKYKVEKLKSVKVGDYIFFGAYEQDNNTSNGKEDIEWIVLEVKDGKALVISKYALDAEKYYEIGLSVTWETCSLREWLNIDFMDSAFNSVEKGKILTVNVSADENPETNSYPGRTTQDKVFLLSITEANKYFKSNSDRQCEPTKYANANGAAMGVNANNGNQIDTCIWWLRTPGGSQENIACVGYNGGISNNGDWSYNKNGVRPALWIDLNS